MMLGACHACTKPYPHNGHSNLGYTRWWQSLAKHLELSRFTQVVSLQYEEEDSDMHTTVNAILNHGAMSLEIAQRNLSAT